MHAHYTLKLSAFEKQNGFWKEILLFILNDSIVGDANNNCLPSYTGRQIWVSSHGGTNYVGAIQLQKIVIL